MRRLCFILALAVGFIAQAGAKIEWNKTRHDFGAFHESAGPATAVFTFRNTGDEPLVITGARANCGCTTPVTSTDIVQPGDSATLTVTYDPAGHAGRFEKRVFVDSNTTPSRSNLYINGVSIGSPATVQGKYPVEVGRLRLAHPAVLLGTIKKGHVKSVFEGAYNASADTLHPVISDLPDWLEVRNSISAVPPGEQVGFNFFIKSDKIPLWDVVTDTVTVWPDSGNSFNFRLPVIVTVNEDFTGIPPRRLEEAPAALVSSSRLDPVTIGADGVASALFTIKNTGKSILKIRRIYTLTPGVEVNVKPDTSVKSNKTLIVPVTIKREALGKSNVGAVKLTIVTNDPISPKSTVTIPVSIENY